MKMASGGGGDGKQKKDQKGREGSVLGTFNFI